jgi:hypothetical protein
VVDLQTLNVDVYSEEQMDWLMKYAIKQGQGDIFKITQESAIPFGPTYLRLCDDCLVSVTRQSRRIVMVDCRVDVLQAENMLPRCTRFHIPINCKMQNLAQ